MSDIDAVQLVRSLFTEQFTNWPGDAFSILAEDIVLQASGGQVYVGHEGYAQWYREQVQANEDRGFVERGAETIKPGWVMISGETTTSRRDGDEFVQPGFWLVHVRDEFIAAVLFFRTEAEARNALAR